MKAALVIPKYFAGNKIFDPVCRDNVSRRYILLRDQLKGHGIDLATYDINPPDQCDISLHFDVHPWAISNKTKGKKLLVIAESPIINKYNRSMSYVTQYDRILTWDSDRANARNTFWLGCGCSSELLDQDEDEIIKAKTRDICIIAGNKRSREQNELYSERDRAIRWFEKSKFSFDMYGAGWNERIFKGVFRPFNRLRIFKKILYKPPNCYKGSVESKFTTLRNYRFSLCFENVSGGGGYISEKIFDSMFSGCVPIYLGASDIDKFVPTDTYIDMRNFNNYENLANYISCMSNDNYQKLIEAIVRYYPAYLKTTFYDRTWAEEITNHCCTLLNIN